MLSTDALNLVEYEIVGVSAIACVYLSYRVVNGWWQHRQFQRRQEELRNSPRVLKLQIEEMTAVVGRLEKINRDVTDDNVNLRNHNREQRDEIRLLTNRCKMLANEARSDSHSETIPLDRARFQGRWADKLSGLGLGRNRGEF